MREIVGLLSRFLFTGANSLEALKGVVFIRLMANLTAFFLLAFGYVLGCRALYHYLKPYGGEIFSLLAICGLLLVTSLFLFIIAWLLRPKTQPSTNLVSVFERIAREIPSDEVIKKIASFISIKSLLSVFTVAAIYSYLSSSEKKKIDF